MTVSRLLALLCLAFFTPTCAFLINHQVRLPGMVGQSTEPSTGSLPPKVHSTQLTQIFAKERDETTPYSYGNDRGNVLLVVVMAFCVWQFTIPPSFRRAHICYSDACIEQRSACSDCVTIHEWTSDVSDYYKNGGGVKWDFSIDPRTMEQNQQKWDEVFGGKK